MIINWVSILIILLISFSSSSFANDIIITINGDTAIGSVTQTGQDNSVSVDITGSDYNGNVVQMGDNHSLDVTGTGYSSTMDIQQLSTVSGNSLTVNSNCTYIGGCSLVITQY